MKSLILVFAFLFAIFLSSSQNYQITFAASGSSSSVDNVLVENLTQGHSITLNGTDILQLSQSVGIETLNGSSQSFKIYPNPMGSECFVSFDLLVSDWVTVELYNMGGSKIAQTSTLLSQGQHRFSLSGINSGIYTLKMSCKSFSASGKLISHGSSSNQVAIKHVSTSSLSQKIEETNHHARLNKSAADNNVAMQYNSGDVLKFTGQSGNYRTVVVLNPVVSGILTFMFTPCIDKDNNAYAIVFYGTQAWMAENLKTTKYDNGDLIGTTNPATADISAMATPKYQWAYGGIDGHADIYGRLYTWFTVTDSRNVCPSGWHIPSDAEWTVLTDSWGGLETSGGVLKETGTVHWNNPNIGANNHSGFTALPAGYRHQDGTFGLMRSSAYFWTSDTGTSAAYGYTRYIQAGSQVTTRYGIQSKKLGLSVRCVKD